MAASHPSGDHWNPFSEGSELPASRFATPAESSDPSSPVAMGGPGSCLITAPAGSPDPFMPTPPLPAHEGPQTQPMPKHDTAAGSAAAVRPLTATVGQTDDASAAHRIQTPEQLRQRFAGGCWCSRICFGWCSGLLWPPVNVFVCDAVAASEGRTKRPAVHLLCCWCPHDCGIAPAGRASAGDSTVNPPRLAAEGAHPARLGRQRSASRVIPGTTAGQSFRRRLQRSFSAVR
jgi:hypothetical protein